MALVRKSYFAGGHVREIRQITPILPLLSNLCNTSAQMVLVTIVLLLSALNHSGQITIEALTTSGLIDGGNNVTTAPALPCQYQSQDVAVCKNNGTCFMRNSVQLCACVSSDFTGADCGTLNLKAMRHDVFETGITFFLSTQVYLQNYYSVTTRTPLSESSSIRASRVVTGYVTQVTVTGLEPDDKEYLLCVINVGSLGVVNTSADDYLMNTTAVLGSNLMSADYLNCGIVVTPYDVYGPFTIAAWAITGAIGLALLVVVCCRGISNCRDSKKREKLLNILRRSSSKKKDIDTTRLE